MKLTNLKTAQIIYWTSFTLIFLLEFIVLFTIDFDYSKSSPVWSFIVFALLSVITIWTDFRIVKLKEGAGELLRYGKVFKMHGGSLMAIFMSLTFLFTVFVIHTRQGVFQLNSFAFLTFLFVAPTQYFPIQYDLTIDKNYINDNKTAYSIYLKTLTSIEISESKIDIHGKFNKLLVIELAKFKENEQQKILSDMNKLKMKLGV